MCIAIYKPEGVSLSKELLSTCWENNPDGAGFMYSIENELVVRKGFMSLDLFMDDFCSIDQKQFAMVLHFRIATHGTVTSKNTHPFYVNKNLAFVHNGIIGQYNTNDIKQILSDTQLFNIDVLKKLPDNFLSNDGINELISDFIGSSKLIFMDNTGQATIINDFFGEYDEEGTWFSNDGWKPQMHLYKTGYTMEIDGEKRFVPFGNQTKEYQGMLQPLGSGSFAEHRENDVLYSSDEYEDEEEDEEEDETVWIVNGEEIPNSKMRKTYYCMDCDTYFLGEVSQKWYHGFPSCGSCGSWKVEYIDWR